MVEALCRFRPLFRELVFDPFFAVIVNSLHRVAKETQAKTTGVCGLHGKESINDTLIRILAFIDQQKRMLIHKDALHKRLLRQKTNEALPQTDKMYWGGSGRRFMTGSGRTSPKWTA